MNVLNPLKITRTQSRNIEEAYTISSYEKFKASSKDNCLEGKTVLYSKPSSGRHGWVGKIKYFVKESAAIGSSITRVKIIWDNGTEQDYRIDAVCGEYAYLFIVDFIDVESMPSKGCSPDLINLITSLQEGKLIGGSGVNSSKESVQLPVMTSDSHLIFDALTGQIIGVEHSAEAAKEFAQEQVQSSTAISRYVIFAPVMEVKSKLPETICINLVD